MPARTLEAIKARRRDRAYKALVESYCREASNVRGTVVPPRAGAGRVAERAAVGTNEDRDESETELPPRRTTTRVVGTDLSGPPLCTGLSAIRNNTGRGRLAPPRVKATRVAGGPEPSSLPEHSESEVGPPPRRKATPVVEMGPSRPPLECADSSTVRGTNEGEMPGPPREKAARVAGGSGPGSPLGYHVGESHQTFRDGWSRCGNKDPTGLPSGSDSRAIANGTTMRGKTPRSPRDKATRVAGDSAPGSPHRENEVEPPPGDNATRVVGSVPPLPLTREAPMKTPLAVGPAPADRRCMRPLPVWGIFTPTHTEDAHDFGIEEDP